MTELDASLSMPSAQSTLPLSELYHCDESAWLEEMAALARAGDVAALDCNNLAEYLSDMAKRDIREVVSRLAILLLHLLKWDRQPEKQTRSWELSIREQREELQELLESGTLRNFAEQELPNAYRKAVRRAAVETDLSECEFPTECPFALEQVLAELAPFLPDLILACH
jgi:Domain of unknown function DUF29